MNIVTIDFETYYSKELSLTKVTAEEYIRSHNFEAILMDFNTFLNDRYPITKPTFTGGTPLPVGTVKSVKKMLHEGIAPKIIAIDLNININNVYNIKNGYTHRSVSWE